MTHGLYSKRIRSRPNDAETLFSGNKIGNTRHSNRQFLPPYDGLQKVLHHKRTPGGQTVMPGPRERIILMSQEGLRRQLLRCSWKEERHKTGPFPIRCLADDSSIHDSIPKRSLDIDGHLARCDHVRLFWLSCSGFFPHESIC